MEINSDVNNTVGNLSAFFFLLLFPGFYLYHHSVTAGLFPEFLAGYFLPISLFVILTIAPILIVFFKSFHIRKFYFSAFISLIIACGLIAFLEYAISAEVYIEKALIQTLSLILSWLAFFFIGIGINFRSKWMVRGAVLSGVAILSHLLLVTFETGELQYIAARYYDAGEDAATHQAYARSVLVLSFLIIATSKSRTIQIQSILGAIISLFILSARSEFIALIVVVGVFYLIRLTKDKKLVIPLVIAVGLLVLVVSIQIDQILETRQGAILSLSQDQSWIARKNLLYDSLDRIKSSPFLGDFGGHYRSGGSGSYSHNVLSVWDGYGLLVFLVYIYLVLVPLRFFLNKLMWEKSSEPYHVFSFFVSLASFILLVAAKPVFWSLPALAWGLYASKNYRVN